MAESVSPAAHRRDAGWRETLKADAGELLRKGAANLGVRLVATALALATHLVISRVWGASTLGLYSLAVTVTYSAALFARAGTDSAAVRFVAAVSPADAGVVYRRVLTVTLPLSLAIAAAVWTTAPVLAQEVFDKPALVEPLRALAVAMPLLNLLGASAACFQGRRRVSLSEALMGALPPALTLALLAIAVWRGALAPEVPAYARAVAIALAAGAGFLLWQLLGSRGGAPDPAAPGAPDVRRLMRAAGPMFVSSALYWMLTTTDILVLGIFRPAEDVGLYRAATSIAAAISFAPGALKSIAAPMFAKAYWRREPERLEHLVTVTARASFGAGALIAIALFCLAVPVLRLFGDAFVAARPALIFYGVGLAASAACGPVGVLLNMIGEERAFSRILLVGALANLLLNFTLVPRWGIVGAAASTAASTLLWSVMAAVRARRKLGHPVGVRPPRQGPG